MSGRDSIFGPDGVTNKSSLGFDGLNELMRRGHSETTYSSLCLPEDITARGLESIPNYYYRDDGLKLWNIINNFVRKMVERYYPSDNEFDYHWIPNGSLLLHHSPPTTKGKSSMESVLEIFPNVGESVSFAVMARVLAEKYDNAVLLGCYPEERFDECALKQIIKDFQAELSSLSEEIAKRNSDLEVPYTYLDPGQIENSVTI